MPPARATAGRKSCPSSGETRPTGANGSTWPKRGRGRPGTSRPPLSRARCCRSIQHHALLQRELCDPHCGLQTRARFAHPSLEAAASLRAGCGISVCDRDNIVIKVPVGSDQHIFVIFGAPSNHARIPQIIAVVEIGDPSALETHPEKLDARPSIPRRAFTATTEIDRGINRPG